MYRRLLTVVVMVFSMSASVAADQPVAADKPITLLMSSDDLKMLCLGDGPGPDIGCKIFIQGVVETWMYRDAISANPPKFAARNLPFCENVWHASEDEWKRIVRAALPTAKAAWSASYVVMKSLHDEICKDG